MSMDEIYVKQGCPYCTRAIALLERMGRRPRVYDVASSLPQPQRDVARRIVAQRMTVPQIFLGGRHIGGCDALEELIMGS